MIKRLDDANEQIENLLRGDDHGRIVPASLQLCRASGTAADIVRHTSVDDAKMIEVLGRLERSTLVFADANHHLALPERFGEV